MKIKIEKIRFKVLLAILVIIVLSIIGISVYFTKKYYDSEAGKTKIYTRELKNILELEGNKKIISISKIDVNKDEIEDYVVLFGEPKYEEVDTTKVQIFKSLSSNFEMYNNISIEYIDGNDNTISRYDTKKSFGKDIKLRTFSTDKIVYIQISDIVSGNISLLYLNNKELDGIIHNTIGDEEFLGYTIEGKFNENEGTKLDITLDNYGKEYLAKQDSTFTLDYTDTQVNSTNYRLTYMANKFSDFDIIQSEDKSKIYFICTQYILYSNNDSLNKNEGFVNCKFEIKEEGKLEFNSVEVIK